MYHTEKKLCTTNVYVL